MATSTLSPSRVVSHEEWLKARLDLLAAEKDFTRQCDALTRRRMAMPWERVEKPYRFEGPDGALSLADLFDGRSLLSSASREVGPLWRFRNGRGSYAYTSLTARLVTLATCGCFPGDFNDPPASDAKSDTKSDTLLELSHYDNYMKS